MKWLRRQGFRRKIPRPWPQGQDEAKRKTFVDLVRLLSVDPTVELWFLDETGVEGDPRPRARWALKGKKIYQTYYGSHVRMSVTGMICPRTGEFYGLIFPHSDRVVFQTFLTHAAREISFERKRTIIILDNASWHKSPSINWGPFEPLFLPAYSPDLNPIEELWLLMKGEWFSDFIAKTSVQLTDRLCEALNWIIDRQDANKKTCSIRTEL